MIEKENIVFDIAMLAFTETTCGLSETATPVHRRFPFCVGEIDAGLTSGVSALNISSAAFS
ncbi:hypothetical protein, partial [Streptomyces sp. NPDC051577]|uniref:hypothetical protein n=1 Tax=Streptomyces sp. NPDC051577 TaxID=3155166 RepID=UPI0034421217